MVKETFVRLTDDLDGGEGQESVMFSLDGREYEIDLSAKNAAALRKALDKYVAAARSRTAEGAPRRRRATTSARPARRGSAVDPKAVRVWAAENGIALSSRGRVPASIIDQYRAAVG